MEGYADVAREFVSHCLSTHNCSMQKMGVQSNYVDISSNGGLQQSMDVMDPKSINVAEKDLYYWIKIMISEVETIR